MPLKARYAKTLADLADELRVSVQSLRNFKREGLNLEKVPDKGYAIQKVRRWLDNRQKKRQETKEKKGERIPRELIEERIKQARIVTEDKAFELARKRGEFIALSEVKDRDVRRITAVKDGLYDMVRGAAVDLVGKTELSEIEGILMKHVRRLLENFASMGRTNGEH